MKKILLSVGVIAVFIAYTFMQRHEASTVVLKRPSTVSQAASASQTTASNTTASSTNGSSTATGYKDGTYTGPVEDAFYGNVKIAVTISGGKIVAINFLEHPSDNPNSISINQQAMPLLQQEAIRAQSARVDIISGATDTSQAFIQSLSSALSQAA